jgi:hypothetical protein
LCLIKTSPRLALPGAMGPDGPKVPLELYNGALPHMAQRSVILFRKISILLISEKNCFVLN